MFGRRRLREMMEIQVDLESESERATDNEAHFLNKKLACKYVNG